MKPEILDKNYGVKVLKIMKKCRWSHRKLSENDTKDMKKWFFNTIKLRLKLNVEWSLILFILSYNSTKIWKRKIVIELNISIEMTMKTFDRFRKYRKGQENNTHAKVCKNEWVRDADVSRF